MTEPPLPFRRCFVFVPYCDTGAGLISPFYDYEECRQDVASWFAGRSLPWSWHAVTLGNLSSAIDMVRSAGPASEAVVVNLCDGDDLVDGYPGLSVVAALEAAGLPFTGAGSSFYALSTSKDAMKRRCVAAGILTAPWVTITDPETDLREAARSVGYPLFVKPGAAAAAAGISSGSLVHDHAEAIRRLRRLAEGMHGYRFPPGSIMVERFLPGREFSVLVVADEGAPDGLTALAPVERVFHPWLPADQRFVTFERTSGEYDEDAPPPDGADSYRYAPVEPPMDLPLRAIARDAFRAMGGSGYARVDLRQDADGRLAILEVNANCGLSEDEYSTGGAILRHSGMTMADMLALMLRHAWRRHRGQAD